MFFIVLFGCVLIHVELMVIAFSFLQRVIDGLVISPMLVQWGISGHRRRDRPIQ